MLIREGEVSCLSRWFGKRLAKAFTPMILNNFRTMGALSRAFYERYGDEALPIISRVMGEAGVEGAKIAQSRLRGEGMKAVGELFKMYEMFDLPVEIMELTEEMIHFRHAPPCPFGLEGTSKGLCKAVEARGERMVSTILGEEAEAKIIKCVAAGDRYCEVIYAKSRGIQKK